MESARDEILGTLRIRVEGVEPVFVGIGSVTDVGRYLRVVAHDELIDFDGDDAQFALHQGRAPRSAPADQDFWVAETEGSGEQSLTWDPSSVAGRQW